MLTMSRWSLVSPSPLGSTTYSIPWISATPLHEVKPMNKPDGVEIDARRNASPRAGIEMTLETRRQRAVASPGQRRRPYQTSPSSQRDAGQRQDNRVFVPARQASRSWVPAGTGDVGTGFAERDIADNDRAASYGDINRRRRVKDAPAHMRVAGRQSAVVVDQHQRADLGQEPPGNDRSPCRPRPLDRRRSPPARWRRSARPDVVVPPGNGQIVANRLERHISSVRASLTHTSTAGASGRSVDNGRAR